MTPLLTVKQVAQLELMAKAPKKRGDRYDTSGNPEAEYIDPAQTILVNKRGIADLHLLQVAEEEALAAAYDVLLGEIRIDTPMTCARRTTGE